jgi:hypothetical protein
VKQRRRRCLFELELIAHVAKHTICAICRSGRNFDVMNNADAASKRVDMCSKPCAIASAAGTEGARMR